MVTRRSPRAGSSRLARAVPRRPARRASRTAPPGRRRATRPGSRSSWRSSPASSTCRPASARRSCYATCSASTPPRSPTCSTPARPRSKAPSSAPGQPSRRSRPAERERAPRPNSARERRLVGRFADAVESGDIDDIVDLLTDDALLTMPPQPLEYQGHQAIAAFLRQRAELRGAPLRVVPTRANTQPAFGCYLPDAHAAIARPWGLFVLTLAGRRSRGHHLVRRHRRLPALRASPHAPLVGRVPFSRGRCLNRHNDREHPREEPEMKLPPIVSPQEWETARQELLVEEKELTRARDALAAERRRMPWMAVEKEYEFDGPDGRAEPARPVRRPPPADRLPRLLRARRARLARARLRRLLAGGRPGRPRRPPQRARHNARVRLARAAGGHRAPEGADGLGDALVHAHRRLRRRLRRRRVARHQRLHPRRRPRSSAPTSSTTAATRRWAAPGATSTSPRSGARRSGRTRPRATRRRRPTRGRTGTTSTTTPGRRRSGCPDRRGSDGGRGRRDDRAHRRRAGGGDPAAAAELGGRLAVAGARLGQLSMNGFA